LGKEGREGRGALGHDGGAEKGKRKKGAKGKGRNRKEREREREETTLRERLTEYPVRTGERK